MRFRNLLDEANASAQLLGGRDLCIEPLGDFLGLGLGRLDTSLEHDIGARDLGVLLLVPDADDADVSDILAADELGFEFGRGDLEALCGGSRVSVTYKRRVWVGCEWYGYI